MTINSAPSMIELFSGTGNVAAGFRRAGWHTLTVDLFTDADVQCDVRKFRPPPADFVWASPPCDEFAASSMPWNPRFGSTPSLDLVEAAIRVREESGAAFWILENVKGAAKWIRPILGEPQVIGSVFLWHNLPNLIDARAVFWKEKLSSKSKTERAAMPLSLVRAVVAAVNEARSTLFNAAGEGR